MKLKKVKIRNTTISELTFLFVILTFICLSACPARANEAAEQFFNLISKIKPGMELGDIQQLLGAPLEERNVANNKELLRISWLHGETGVEVYFLKEKVYRVVLARNFEIPLEMARALDGLTRQGNLKYGHMPSFDTAQGEYYWIHNGIRIGFAKNSPMSVQVTSRAR